jgi:ribosomal protein S18 acetylase RimI-like enzyme
MDPDDFDQYFEDCSREYAADHVKTGRWTEEEGLAKAKEEIRKLLPAGPKTPDQFLLTIVDLPSEDKVGVIWLAIEPRGGFIYDLRVYETYRRRGYAEQAMRLIEQVAREKGVDKISLHVFGDNMGARKLYAKLGYSETNVLMAKPLTP